MPLRVRLTAPLKGARIGDPRRAPPRPVVPPRPEQLRREAEQEAARWRSVDDSLASLAEQLQGIEQRRAASLQELQMAAVELAVAVASRVVRECVEAGQWGVEQRVAEVVGRMQSQGPLVVRLHPEELSTLLARIDTHRPANWPAERLRLEPDPSLPRGACQVDGDEYSGVSRIEWELSELRQILLECAEDAQVERRRDAAGDRGLRRFPDRRQTA